MTSNRAWILLAACLMNPLASRIRSITPEENLMPTKLFEEGNQLAAGTKRGPARATTMMKDSRHGRGRFDERLSGLSSVLLGLPVTPCDIHLLFGRYSVASRSRSPHNSTIPAFARLKPITPLPSLTTPMRWRATLYSTRQCW
jgi:hypothetical protein